MELKEATGRIELTLILRYNQLVEDVYNLARSPDMRDHRTNAYKLAHDEYNTKCGQMMLIQDVLCIPVEMRNRTIDHRKLLSIIDRRDLSIVDGNEVSINVQLIHALKLSRWASVGRTIDTAIQLVNVDCGNPPPDHEDDVIYCISELSELKMSLDAVNAACKRWRWDNKGVDMEAINDNS